MTDTPSTDIVPVGNTGIPTLDIAEPSWKLATKLADTDFVPSALKGNSPAVLAAMLTGHELGIQPMAALGKINVIKGTPAISPELMRALVLAEGHEIAIIEQSNTRCKVAGKRKGSTLPATEITWTMDDAKQAGLAGKDNWRQYPRAMLLARATGELCRAIFPDVLAGISYTIPEAEDIAEQGEFEEAPAPARKVGKAKAAKKVTKKRRQTKAEVVDNEPDTDEPKGREMPLLPGETVDNEPDTSEDITNPEQGQAASSFAHPDDEIVDGEIIDDDDPPPSDDDAPPELEAVESEDRSGPLLSGPAQIAIHLKNAGITDREMKLKVTGSIVGRRLDSTKDLTPAEISRILDVVSAEEFDPVEVMRKAAEESAATFDPEETRSWSEDNWRNWLKSSKIKVSVAVQAASNAAADELETPVESLAELVERSHLAPATWRALVGDAS